MDRLFLSLYQLFRQRRWRLWLLVGALVASATAVVISRLELDDNISKVIPLNAGLRQINEAYQNTAFSDQLVFHLEARDSSSGHSTAELIAFADSVVQALWSLDSQRIRSIRYQIAPTAAADLYHRFYEQLPIFLDESDYADLAERLDSGAIYRALGGVYKTLISPTGFVLKKQVLQDPLGLAALPLLQLKELQLNSNYTLHQGRIMTTDQRHLLFFLTPNTDASATGDNAILLRDIDAILDQVRADFDDEFVVEYFGSIAVSVANAQQIQRDVLYTVGVALVVLLIFLVFFFRRLSIPFLLFIPVVLGAWMGLAILVAIKGSISALSLGIGAVLLGIALDFSLHVFTHYRAEGSVTKTIKGIATPTFVSSITSSSAFLCLLYLSSEALRDLGIFAAGAVGTSALFALLILPHFLNPKDRPIAQKTGWLDRLAAYPLHQHHWLVGGIGVLSIAFLWVAPRVQFDRDLNNISYQPSHLRAVDEQLQALSGEALKTSYIVVSANDWETALQQNEQVAYQLDALEKDGRIQRYTSVAPFLCSQATQTERLEQWRSFWTPERIAQLQTNLEHQGNAYGFKSGTFDGFLEHLNQTYQPVGEEYFAPLTELALSEYSTLEEGNYSFMTLVKLDEANRATVYPMFNALEGVAMFDKQFMAQQFAESLQADFSTLVNWSFLVVFIVLLVAFGRIELALLTLLPVLLSWEWTLAGMVILGLKFNVVNIILCTFIFGLGIDYSIFVTKGLLHEYQYGEHVLPTYKTSILLSVITTLCGVGAMIFAHHPALRSIAGLSILGLVSMIVLTFTIQPVLFGALILHRKAKGLPPYTLPNLISTFVAYTHFLLGCLVLTVTTWILRLTPAPADLKKTILHELIYRFSQSLIHLMFNVKKEFLSRHRAQLDHPAILVANHQSFLDIMLLLATHPKMIIMTNDWVWNSPFFGQVIRYADFYPSSAGVEQGLEPLRDLVERGYSIAIFPEGTRSTTGKIGRFKKGAFYVAEQLGLDILPVVFHGTGHCIRKGDFLVHGTTVTMEFLERISPKEAHWGADYAARTKRISRHFKTAYQALSARKATPAFYRDALEKNYLYKGPVLEWYVRIKLMLEKNYVLFDRYIPQKGTITDIGCGYGTLTYMLYLLGPERQLLGLDHDHEKIHTAREGYLKHPNINFKSIDVNTCILPKSDVFILSDVLHYLRQAEQRQLLEQCVSQLKPGGCLLIRDGDADLQVRHEGTVWTERFSTQILQFNKTTHDSLHFLSGRWLEAFAQKHRLKLTRVDVTQKTSNILFILQQP